MKLEIHIPELAELNTNVRQLIDTLNDLGCVAYAIANKQVREKPAASPTAAEATADVSPAAEVEPEKPKRTRKAKIEEPAPEPVAAESEPQVEPVPTAVEPEPEQPVATEPEQQPEPENAPNTHVLADCTALAAPLQTSGKLDEAKAWLKEHGADRLKDLDPSHYGAFITFAKGLLG
jgi:outer membrane biosynthesis protein TonB